MYRWDQALYGEKLVKAATLARAFTPGRLNNGRATGYGFGWFVDPDLVKHDGAWLGYRTSILRIPDKHFTVVVLSNLAQFNPGSIAEKIRKIYLAEPVGLSQPSNPPPGSAEIDLSR